MAIVGWLKTKVVKGDRIGQYRQVPVIVPVKSPDIPILKKPSQNVETKA